MASAFAASLWVHGVAPAQTTTQPQPPPLSQHPRLFFSQEAIAGFREKAGHSPWQEMLEAIEWAMEHDRNATYAEANVRPSNPAALFLFRGDSPRAFSEEALADTLFLILAPDREGKPVWAHPGCRALTRATRGLQVAIAFDLCYGSWQGRRVPETFRTRDGRIHPVPAKDVGQPLESWLSRQLKENADVLIESGGPGWPGNLKWGNNWHAVRFASAALQYLACDEPRASWEKNFDRAVRQVVQHKEANLTRQADSQGYNPEGTAYAQYPGWFTYPLVLALRRLEGRDLTREIPGMQRELWATYHGILPLPRRSRLDSPGTGAMGLGLRPDFSDDHPIWEGEGTAALAFAVSPQEYLPGLKWIFRRLVGDLGDQTWDAASGNGLYALLFYPHDLPEKNPAEVWGLAWQDPSFGMFLFRNRFKDEQDIVAQIVAKLRPTFGGHEGRDALSFRILGLGIPWAVGSGRTTDLQGQTSLFPGDPEKLPNPPPGMVSAVVDSFLRASGDGWVTMSMELTDTGVRSQVRQFVVDYSGQSGAPALFVVSDRSENGRFWRMNTPDFNKIETSENRFTITAPGGQKLAARILYPPSKVMPRTGNFPRGSSYAFGSIGLRDEPGAFGTQAYQIGNRWVDFESSDGQFLVAMVLLPADAYEPEIAGAQRDKTWEVRVGNQSLSLEPEQVRVQGWTRPRLTIEFPEKGAVLQGEGKPGELGGSVEDPEGVASVVVSVPGQSPQPARIEGTQWRASLQGLARGTHHIQVLAKDRVGDTSSAQTVLHVCRTAPPLLEITNPPSALNLPPGSTLSLQGKVRDPEGRLSRVEIFRGEELLGTARIEGDFWEFQWPEIPIGRHFLSAIATDADDDPSHPREISLTATVAVGEGNVSDAASLWIGSFNPKPVSPKVAQRGKGSHPLPGSDLRWSIRDTEDGPVLRVRPTDRWDYSDRHLWILGSDTAKDWALEWKMRMLSPLDQNASAQVHFGTGISGSIVMEFTPFNSAYFEDRRGRRGSGTRLWYQAPNDNRIEIGWTPNARRRQQPQDSTPAERDFAGFPDHQWHQFRMEKRGTQLRVLRDGQEILSAESPWLATRGPVGFANERLIGSEFEIRNLHFEKFNP